MMGLFAFVTVPTWLAILWRKLHHDVRRAKGPHSRVRHILVVRLDQMGDLLLATPLLRELKRLYSQAHLTVVVRREYVPLLSTNTSVDEIVPLRAWHAPWCPRHLRKFVEVLWLYASRLRHRSFDMVISPRFDLDEDLATLLCVLVGAQLRVGQSSHASPAKRRLNWGFDAAWDLLVPVGTSEHEVDRNLAVARALGGRFTSRYTEVVLTFRDLLAADHILRNHDPRRSLVALGIGGRSRGRQWPLERYAELVKKLNAWRPVQPVIVCSKEEDAMASALSVLLPVPPYVLAGRSLRTVCAVLERCDAFIGNDTGSAHLAAAMSCPTVVVSRHPLGGDRRHANSPVRFQPIADRSAVLQPDSPSRECRQACRMPDPHCILQVTVDSVLAATQRVMLDSTVDAPVFREHRDWVAPPMCAHEELQEVV